MQTTEHKDDDLSEEAAYPLLHAISSPADWRAMPESNAAPLADELRRFLIEHVSRTGGHLASNLGVVELTLALHRVFDTPHDRIIWDVGHQSYVHKLLTGRKNFDTLRQVGGLSGFTRREESEYDPFGAGHSSTALSAAIGFAAADSLAGRDNYTVAVVGDGAFTGGMVHEALNNMGDSQRLIMVLNENEMSISRNTGKFARHLLHIRTSERYRVTKVRTNRLLNAIPLLGRGMNCLLRRLKNGLKRLVYAGNYFENLGIRYLGPVDGNDYRSVVRVLRAARRENGCVVVHIKTQKGKGYQPAEEQPNAYHSVYTRKPEGQTFSSAFGVCLTALAASDPRICAITAAMAAGTGLTAFADEYPRRFFDVGIAEDHALTFAAGLAAAGMKPFVAVYSSFLQRAYDSILHDIVLQKLPVTLCIDRAGIAAGDGPTHYGIFDVAFLSETPYLPIYTPATVASLRAALACAAGCDGPCAVRYPNASDDPAVVAAFPGQEAAARFRAVRTDYTDPRARNALVIAYGTTVARALEAAQHAREQGMACGVMLLERLGDYPALAAELLGLLPPCGRIVLLEEGVYQGGAAMLLREALLELDPRLAARVGICAMRDPYAMPRDGGQSLDRFYGVSAEDVLLALQQ